MSFLIFQRDHFIFSGSDVEDDEVFDEHTEEEGRLLTKEEYEPFTVYVTPPDSPISFLRLLICSRLWFLHIIFMDFSDENETGFFSMRRISRLITNTLRWSLFDLFLILLSLKKLFYFRSWSNCYLHLLAYYVKPGNDTIALLFLDLSPPTGGTLKINFYSENINYLVFFRAFVLVTLVHRIFHRCYHALDFFQVVVKVGIQSINDLNERVF